MRCAWQECLKILPIWMRNEVDKQGKDDLQELRLREGQLPVLIKNSGKGLLSRKVVGDDLNYVINSASQYSPWSAATTSKGYLTALGGHRIGICGDAVVQNGSVTGMRSVSSLCIRVARDFPNIAADAQKFQGSILIIGPPGSGKTTLLRDLIRQRSGIEQGSIAVIDERGEVFPAVNGVSCFPTGDNTDILTSCGKRQGIDMLLRTMGPRTIAVDEITEESDCKALLCAAWSGVSLIATAHAASKEDLCLRSVYRPLIEKHLFDTLLILQQDKSWRSESL